MTTDADDVDYAGDNEDRKTKAPLSLEFAEYVPGK
jgi:hypothetical protein